MTFQRIPDYVEELIIIRYYNSREYYKIIKGISELGKEDNRVYDFDVDTDRYEILVTVDDYNDYRRLKNLIFSA